MVDLEEEDREQYAPEPERERRGGPQGEDEDEVRPRENTRRPEDGWQACPFSNTIISP